MSLDTSALAALFEMSRDAVLGTEGDTVRFLNPPAKALFGLEAGESAASILPKEILFDPADRFTAAAVIGGRAMELSAVRQNSLTIWHVYPPADTAPPYTDRVNAEFGNALASAQAAIDALVAGTESAQDERLRDYAAMLYRSYFRMRRLHSHMTLAAAIRTDSLSFRPKPLSLERIVRELCQSVDLTVRPRGVTVRYEGPKSPCWARIDQELFESMLLNLLANSLMSTPKGGEILVSLTVQEERCTIAVRDNGSGIPVDRMSTLLRGVSEAPLTDPGTGASLGLFIARGVAEAHGGSLILESRENIGTSVRIILPRLPDTGIDYLSQPDAFFHTDGMRPILTELSVYLDRSFYRKNMLD